MPTVRYWRKKPAPSTLAAEMSSSGIAPRAYWRIQKMPNAFAAPGMISAFSDPIQPNSASVTNCGTRDSWAGIMNVASSNPKSQVAAGELVLRERERGQ